MSRLHSAFTLIEILIVVVILGILAAIVIPQFNDASESAKSSSVRSQLQTIRSQMQLYLNQNGSFPDLAGGWAPLTNRDENVSGSPHLPQPPVNPFTNSSAIAATAGAGVGWVWDATERQIRASISQTDFDSIAGSSVDFATYSSTP